MQQQIQIQRTILNSSKNPILKSKFYADEQHSKQIQAFYFEQKIVFYSISNQNTLEKILFQIKLPSKSTYYIIRSSLEKQNIYSPLKKVGKYLGIRFQSLVAENIFQIYSTDPKLLANWKSYLEKDLKQKGFNQIYKSYKKLAKGTNATVYYAIRLQDERKTAIKAFSKELLLSEPKGLEILDNQISIMRQLNHKNIIKLYEVLETQNSIYISIQYLRGGQLFQFIKKPKIKYNQIKVIIQQLLQALKYLKQMGIVHRDLKAENILMRSSTSLDLVIADFGLATRIKDENQIFLRCGTPGCVAPEILNSNCLDEQTCASDMFSLGVLLHQIIFKRQLFPGTQYRKILQKNKKCQFSFQQEIYKLIDKKLLNMLQMMLEKNPNKRLTPDDGLQHQFLKGQFDEQKQIQVNFLEQEDEKSQYGSQKAKKNKFIKVQDSFGIFYIGKQSLLKGNQSSDYDSQSNPMSPFTPDPKKFSDKICSNKQSRFSLIQNQKSSYFKTNSESRKRNHAQKEKRITLNDLQSQ